MTPDVYITQGDTGPNLVSTLRDSNGDVVNLTGATVRFLMTARGGSTLKVNGSASIVGDATGGVVSYAWQSADTDTAGDFNAEFEVTFSGGAKQTFPNSRYLRIQVKPQLG